MEIEVGGYRERVGPGYCVLIQVGSEHQFRADEQARFLVADLDELPPNMRLLRLPFASVSSPLPEFCRFAQMQLQHRLNPALETSMGKLFMQLLAEQEFVPRADRRIALALDHLGADLRHTPPLVELASKACLSLSQYKALFKRETGKSTGQYLLMLRMEHARALLAHTDYPLAIVAGEVGYRDVSSFSRRFSAYFGQPPSRFRGPNIVAVG